MLTLAVFAAVAVGAPVMAQDEVKPNIPIIFPDDVGLENVSAKYAGPHQHNGA